LTFEHRVLDDMARRMIHPQGFLERAPRTVLRRAEQPWCLSEIKHFARKASRPSPAFRWKFGKGGPPGKAPVRRAAGRRVSETVHTMTVYRHPAAGPLASKVQLPPGWVARNFRSGDLKLTK
jgi:hypothetical protein